MIVKPALDSALDHIFDAQRRNMFFQKINQKDFISKVIITSTPLAILCFFYYNDIILPETFQFFLLGYLFIILILPIIFKYNYTFKQNVVFLNIVNLPKFAKFKNPARHGLNGTRNFYLKSNDGIYLGVWHVLPERLIKENLAKEDEEEYYEKTLSFDYPVFVYMHGNSSNRAAGHHIELHKVLRKNAHVITFDYRGYGDSGGLILTENLVINDALTILKWVNSSTTAPVFVWGHSLGTGVATHTLRQLTEQNNCYIKGLILESPFDNMLNEVCYHPFTIIFRHLPWFRYTVLEPIGKYDFLFTSDDHIKYVNCPILFLHAEDDWIIPFNLGFKLYCIASKHRTPNQGPVQFEKFPKGYGYGHKRICRAPQLPTIIKNFTELCLK